MPTGATMFSGGGVAEALLKTSVDIRWAIEYDPAIAAVYRRNIGDHIIVGDVRHQDYGALGYVDWLHASPVCTRASVANTGAVESDLDIEMAQAVVRALEAVQPRAFTLENVWGYRTFQAFRRICQALDALGYWYSYEHLNSADFGVPQTRRRLILRATRDRLLPTLPEPTPWRGWYEAIEDLIPTLPETQFAPWQIDRLTAHGAETVLIGGNRSQSFLDFALKHRPTIPSVFSRHEPSFAISSTASSDARAFIVDGQAADHGARVTTRPGDAPMFTVNAQAGARQALRAWLVSNAATEYSDGLRADAEPALAVTHQHGGRLRAVLVRGGNTKQEWGDGVRDAIAPAYTVTTDTPRAWLAAGRVVKMTPRCLARFQSLPDSYGLPDKAALATRIIGNGWPSEMAQRIVEQLI